MPISPARLTAFEILFRVDQQDAFASELLHSSAYQKLSTADHHLATELVMGVLRWRSLLDEQLTKYSSHQLTKLDPEVLTALRLASYQLMFLDRIPARAAIYESVELVKRARKRSASPFVNALLRKLVGVKTHPASPQSHNAAELARSSAHPEWLVERWIREFSIETAKRICDYDQEIPQTALMISGAIAQEVEKHGSKLAPGRLLSSSRRLVAGDLGNVPSDLRAQIAIQDEASQLVGLLVGNGSRILDCCAAPGGKTRLLAASNPSALVVAAELHPHRAHLLKKLVTAPNLRLVVADARALPIAAGFDRILVDVPCSGTGTLARNPEIKWRLKPEDLPDLQTRQIAILRSAMQQLIPGGRLVYATCSLERAENEEVIEQVIAADNSFEVVDSRERLRQLQVSGELEWPSLESLTRGPYLRTIPGIHPCDGFFAAILKKR